MVFVQRNGVILGIPEPSNHQHGTRFKSMSSTEDGSGKKSPVKSLNYGLNHDSTICKQCPKLVGKENAARCTKCKGWLHQKCTGLTKHEFEFLCNTPTTKLLYICSLCQSGSPAQTNEQVNPIYEDRLDKIEKMCQQFGEQSKEIFELLNNKKEERKEEKKKDNIQVSLSVQEAMKEQQDQEEKKNNLILFNLTEFHGEEEENDDIQRVKDVLGFIKGIPMVDVLDNSTVSRLGYKKEDPDSRPRAIKIVFGSYEKKMAILRNAKKLATHEDFRKLGLSPDRTAKERTADLILREEYLRRKAAGEDIKISRGKIVPRTPTTQPKAAVIEDNTTVENGDEA